MRMIDLIEKKRDGLELTNGEIDFIVQGYTNGAIPDYQMSALQMAIYFQGMSLAETTNFTMAMAASGDQVDLSAIEGIKVDKHSTGGVGDTATLVLAPLVAALGIPVAKMSGRGLGHTGGTLDKLEAIPGFHVEITDKDFFDLINQNKIAVIGQSGNLTPADQKIYSLRDVTGTVNSIPLIASSIMSKKIAAGSDAIVLDVKVGTGAFMKDLTMAGDLARTMVQIGNKVGRRTMAIISDMNQPLGYAIGNSLEIREAVETLQGQGPEDLRELCLTLGSHMACLAGKTETVEEARKMLEEVIENGKAFELFKLFLQSQGGDISVIDDMSKLPAASYQIDIPAKESGYISKITANEIGTAAMMLGAGRETKDSVIDLAVGLVLHKKIGDPVKIGESLVTVHSNTENIEAVKEKIYHAYGISASHIEPPVLIHDEITK